MDLNSKEHEEFLQLADELKVEGANKLREGKLKEAEITIRRAAVLYERVHEYYKKASALNLLSIVYDDMGNESMCLECMLDALGLAERIEAFDMAAKVMNNIGSKLLNLKSFHRALYYLNMAKETFDKACSLDPDAIKNNPFFVLVLNLNLSSTYCYMGEFTKARTYYLLAKAQTDNVERKELLFTFMSYEGLILWKIGDREESLRLLDGIMERAKETEYTTDYLAVMSDLISLLKEMKDYDRWKTILELIDSRLTTDVGISVRMEQLSLWIDYYHDSGQMEEYAAGCQKYFEMSKEKTLLEYSHRADTIELKADMRRTLKEKEHTDSIVYLDPLTGIGNRNKMLEDSKQFIAESAVSRRNITIGLIDIDFFKECNDTYGHIEGDECLKKVASAISNAVGKRGNVYRYGGDEFLVLLSAMSEEEVLEMGGKIKDALAKEQIPNKKSPIVPFVTVSQGYTKAVADEGDTIDDLVNLADRVLYYVKRGGRNDYRFMRYEEIVADISE